MYLWKTEEIQRKEAIRNGTTVKCPLQNQAIKNQTYKYVKQT